MHKTFFAKHINSILHTTQKKKSCPTDNSFSFDVVFTTNYIAATSFTTSAATSATSGAPQVVATEAMRNVAATVRIA